ncbi:MAG: 16S rRNA (adenine(1518)-N(6)/adenine(1519)-N(6))-dimethyltransferase RsmA [Gemmatimonadota bacterium]
MTSRPKRSLGQNFLVDPGLRRRIVEAVQVEPGETVLEIGPGRGALTEGLVEVIDEREGHLVAVELDDSLAEALKRRFDGNPRVRIIHGSVLDLSLDEVLADPTELKVVGNIPYNLTSPILFHLLERPRPREILLMVQREVADRILAPPGGGDYGALSIGVRTVAAVERVLHLGPGAFRPRPRVDSTVIRLLPFHPAPLTPGEEAGVRVLTRALFQWRRKQLGKSFRDHPDLSFSPEAIAGALAAAGAATTDRPEQLSPEAFIAAARSLASDGSLTGGLGAA